MTAPETFDRETLEAASREALIEHAMNLGIERPEVLTRVELVDEILRARTPDPVERRQARGWLGVARDLLASVVEQGLNLPEAAAVIRGELPLESMRPPQPPIATVTLAQIYAAQGHTDRAVATLEEVLAAEPDHPVALRLREELRNGPAVGAESVSSSVPGGDEPNEPDHAAFEDDEQPPPEPTPIEAEGAGPPTSLPPPQAGLSAASLSAASPGNPAGGAGMGEPALRGRPPPAAPPREPGGVEPAPEHGEAAAPADSRTAADPNTTAGPVAPVPSPGPSVNDREMRTLPGDDALVTLRLPGGDVYVYWELAQRPTGAARAVIRLLECHPDGSRVRRVEHRLAADSSVGGERLVGVSPEAVVRAVLGLEATGDYRPLAVAIDCRPLEGDLVDVLFVPWRRADLTALAHRAAEHAAQSA